MDVKGMAAASRSDRVASEATKKAEDTETLHTMAATTMTEGREMRATPFKTSKMSQVRWRTVLALNVILDRQGAETWLGISLETTPTQGWLVSTIRMTRAAEAGPLSDEQVNCIYI